MDDPSVAIAYCCPVESFGFQHFTYAARFADSLRQFSPESDYRLAVVSNGGDPSSDVKELFRNLDPQFIIHDDTGMDIGAYQVAAQTIAADLMVFFGGSSYIRGKGWCRRVVEAYKKRGNALYGVMACGGNAQFGVYPHIRTTGFWMPRALFNQYPTQVRSTEQRYPFEHGENCLTQWVQNQGMKAYVVTWQSEYEPNDWHAIPGGYHNGNQHGLLFGDRMSEPPFHPYR
jgi:hypothetical protein